MSGPDASTEMALARRYTDSTHDSAPTLSSRAPMSGSAPMTDNPSNAVTSVMHSVAYVRLRNSGTKSELLD